MMRQDSKYVFWSERPGNMWRACFHGRKLFIEKWLNEYMVIHPDFTFLRAKPFPSLNLAKRAGSKWLREQAGAKSAKPGGGRQR